MTFLKIYNISRKCRKRLEKYARDFNFPDTLEELCAISSATLFEEFKKHNIKSEIIGNSFHCFIRIEDRIVDLTATQFGIQYPKILITKHEKMSDNLYYKEEKTFTSVKRLYNWQYKKEWPNRQLATIIKENHYGRI